MGCTNEELELKKRFVEQLDWMDKQHTENITKCSDNMDKLTNCISNGFGLLKQLLQPQMYSQQSMYVLTNQWCTTATHHLYLPIFEDTVSVLGLLPSNQWCLEDRIQQHTRALLCSFRQWSNVLPVCPMYTFHSCHMESDTPHLPAVVGVRSPLGAPKSDEGFGEAGSKCRHPKGSGSSVLSLTGVGCMVGLLQLYDD